MSADPDELIEDAIPQIIREKFRVASYRKAASVLRYGLNEEFVEILEALEAFEITTEMIRRPGGNESEVPKVISALLRPKGWNETTISGDLHITRSWREAVVNKNGKVVRVPKSEVFVRKKYLDGHKIDYVKNRVAFDFEWNSKDQTFDRDLYAFAAFAEAGAIDAAIIVTRDTSLNHIFSEIGQALDKDGNPAFDAAGQPVRLLPKYGASTTWWGKLIYRLNAGRNGGCPVLALGIKPECISDLNDWRETHSAASTDEL
ncbi:restriction endonuclease [Roseitalea porphyridii]|uniref:Restriction endonuclease n=1 Tax=Roseitalea porphyridii TaxID=1852022 RepID=A0A4P6V481_9HYPH|nr:restriction endonuclease [Roseitalea porphyridii]